MNIEKLLRENNIRVTKNRVTILKILEKNNKAVTADYIFEICKKNGDKVDLSTIYRTIDLLEEKDILNKFDTGEGKYNYILKNKCHKHILYCDLCHKKIEIDCPLIQVEEIVRNKTGFTFLEKEIKLKCICEECRRKKELKKASENEKCNFNKNK